METMYQRSKIQEESLYYETLKHTEFPIIGVNTLSSKGSPTVIPAEVIRATEKENCTKSQCWRTCIKQIMIKSMKC
jgi:methylmalonyl-CoA mutase